MNLNVQKNFDIAGLRIHVERWIGQARDWQVLNTIWPRNRIDLLSSTWGSVCGIIMGVDGIFPGWCSGVAMFSKIKKNLRICLILPF